MKVIKRNGKLQELEEGKIATSVANAADDAGTVLNQSDLEIITRESIRILKIVRKDDLITSSYEIIGVVIKVLKENGFNKVCKAYLDFSSK